MKKIILTFLASLFLILWFNSAFADTEIATNFLTRVPFNIDKENSYYLHWYGNWIRIYNNATTLTHDWTLNYRTNTDYIFIHNNNEYNNQHYFYLATGTHWYNSRPYFHYWKLRIHDWGYSVESTWNYFPWDSSVNFDTYCQTQWNFAVFNWKIYLYATSLYYPNLNCDVFDNTWWNTYDLSNNTYDNSPSDSPASSLATTLDDRYVSVVWNDSILYRSWLELKLRTWDSQWAMTESTFMDLDWLLPENHTILNFEYINRSVNWNFRVLNLMTWLSDLSVVNYHSIQYNFSSESWNFDWWFENWKWLLEAIPDNDTYLLYWYDQNNEVSEYQVYSSNFTHWPLINYDYDWVNLIAYYSRKSDWNLYTTSDVLPWDNVWEPEWWSPIDSNWTMFYNWSWFNIETIELTWTGILDVELYSSWSVLVYSWSIEVWEILWDLIVTSADFTDWVDFEINSSFTWWVLTVDVKTFAEDLLELETSYGVQWAYTVWEDLYPMWEDIFQTWESFYVYPDEVTWECPFWLTPYTYTWLDGQVTICIFNNEEDTGDLIYELTDNSETWADIWDVEYLYSTWTLNLSFNVWSVAVNTSWLDEDCEPMFDIDWNFNYTKNWNPWQFVFDLQNWEAFVIWNRWEVNILWVNVIGWLYDVLAWLVSKIQIIFWNILEVLFNLFDDWFSAVRVPDREENYCFLWVNMYLGEHLTEYYSYKDWETKIITGKNSIEYIYLFLIVIFVLILLYKKI